ncbi:MAG: GNAT family N-acetyltransferase [Candidatus Acidiferrales bacterium]
MADESSSYDMQVLADILIRHPEPQEHDSVRALVTTVANETFGDLFAPSPVPLKLEDDDWSLAWVAVSDAKIVGVVLTRQEWISDLWVLREIRRHGVGRRLLAQGESEIASRGHSMFHLRVVKSNKVAVQFYLGQGWRIGREFPHEKFQHQMFEMVKSEQTVSTSK